MIFGILTLLTALSISAASAYFSIVGLSLIFGGAFWSVVVMGCTLEAGKLVAASWLYRHWKTAALAIKSYLITSVVTLMLINSIGIFGYLSRAHLEQAAVGAGNQLQISRLDTAIQAEQETLNRTLKTVDQLDKSIDNLLNQDRTSQGLEARRRQTAERSQLNESIKKSRDKIEGLQDQKLPLMNEKAKFEAELGPLKYVAEFLYGDEAKDHFGAAVRWTIIIIVLVFDPLAVLLLIAANQSLTFMKKSEDEDDGMTSIERLAHRMYNEKGEDGRTTFEFIRDYNEHMKNKSKEESDELDWNEIDKMGQLDEPVPEPSSSAPTSFLRMSKDVMFGTVWPTNPQENDLFIKVDTHSLYCYSRKEWKPAIWSRLDGLDLSEYVDYLVMELNKGTMTVNDLNHAEMVLIEKSYKDVQT